MANKKSIVITTYGHDKTIDKIAVSTFESSSDDRYYSQETDAETYCNTINALELKGDSWVFAKKISENSQYALNVFLPLKFSDVIMQLNNMAIQKTLREIDSQEIAKALKSESEEVKERIFSNMSKRASQMLKEDIEYMGPIRLKDVEKSQETILNIIRRLDQTGEIVIPDQGTDSLVL